MVTQTQTFPVRDLKGPVPRMGFTPNPLLPPAGLGVVEQPLMHANGIQRIRLNVTNLVIYMVGTTTAFGGTLLGYLPTRNLIFLGGEVNLTWTKDGAGIATGDTPKFAVGTVVASNATLSTTMQNLINGAAGGTALASGLTGLMQLHSNDNGTPALVFLPDSATQGIFFNVGGAISVTLGTLTVSGTIDLFYIDLEKAV